MLSESLHTIGRWLGIAKPSGADEERRTWGRVPCKTRTVCRRAGSPDAVPFEVQTRNVSQGGICLVGHTELRPGALISVLVPNAPGQNESSELLACVIRCDARGGGVFELGCTFAGPLADDEIRRFVHGPDEPAVVDLRGHQRFEMSAEVAFSVVRTPEETHTTPGVLENISGGGIAMRVEAELRVGDLLSVEVRKHGRLMLSALASVVRTTLTASGERHVACIFIRELDEAQVMHLVD